MKRYTKLRKMSTTTATKTITFGELPIGTIVNFNRSVTADNSDYIVISHTFEKWGNYTNCIQVTEYGQKIEGYRMDSFTQHTQIKNMWSIVELA